jgi:DNA-binding response OmpR family regulator
MTSDSAGTPPRTIIQVVDDDERLCRALSASLASHGYDVLVTLDPAQARPMALAGQPDLILCDIAMPSMDGFEVLAQLQADPQTAHLPVIFITGSPDETHKVRAFRFGVVDYLEKPLRAKVLVDAIDRILRELPTRSGVVGARGVEAAASLLRNIRDDARTGFLTLRGETGEVRTLVNAGRTTPEVAHQTIARPTEAQFEEMNLLRAQVMEPAAPPDLSGTFDKPVDASDIPPVFRKVLIAEDDNAFRFYLASLLRNAGFEVFEAADGQDAIDQAIESRPWLILSDVDMPRLDGFDLCHALRRHTLLSAIPVVLLSGWDDVRTRIRGLDAGADDYLSKLSPAREVITRVVMMLSRYTTFANDASGSGNIEGRLAILGPAGLLQMCNLTRLSGVLNVRGEDGEARMHFENGEIVDATSRGESGVDAVYEFLSWDSGRFRFDNGIVPPTRSVFAGFEHILFEGIRRIDELARRTPSG